MEKLLEIQKGRKGLKITKRNKAPTDQITMTIRTTRAPMILIILIRIIIKKNNLGSRIFYKAQIMVTKHLKNKKIGECIYLDLEFWE